MSVPIDKQHMAPKKIFLSDARKNRKTLINRTIFISLNVDLLAASFKHNCNFVLSIEKVS